MDWLFKEMFLTSLLVYRNTRAFMCVFCVCLCMCVYVCVCVCECGCVHGVWGCGWVNNKSGWLLQKVVGFSQLFHFLTKSKRFSLLPPPLNGCHTKDNESLLEISSLLDLGKGRVETRKTCTLNRPFWHYLRHLGLCVSQPFSNMIINLHRISKSKISI